MHDLIKETIHKEFKEEERALVHYELFSIGLQHVMGQSETNLNNVRLSILKLAQGDLNEVIELTTKAKIDFRDVIMWAVQKK